MGRWRQRLVAAAGGVLAIACSEPNPLYGLTESGSSSGIEEPESTSSTGDNDNDSSSNSDASNNDASSSSTTTTSSSSSGESVTSHRIFTTRTWHRGNLGGIAGADAECNAVASQAGLPATFRAIVSIDGDPVSERLSVNGPVHNVLGELVAADADEFWSGSLRIQLNVDARGNTAAGEVWTGSTPTGGSESANCGNWTVGMPSGDGVRGRAAQTDERWISAGPKQCNEQLRLYCLEQ